MRGAWLLAVVVLAGCASPAPPEPPPPPATPAAPPTVEPPPPEAPSPRYDGVADVPGDDGPGFPPCGDASTGAFAVRFDGRFGNCRLSPHAILSFQGSSVDAVPMLWAGVRPRTTFGMWAVEVANASAYWDAGSRYDLRHLGCDIEQAWHGDVGGPVAANCTTAVRVAPAPPPRLGEVHLNISDAGAALAGGRHDGYFLLGPGSEEPLLAMLMPDFELRGNAAATARGGFRNQSGESPDLPFQVLVADGYGELRMTPAELYGNVTKLLRIGGAEVRFTPHRLAEGDVASKDFAYELAVTRLADPPPDAALLVAFGG